MLPVFIHASTPNYQGSHMDGFHEAVYAAVATLADKNTKSGAHINLFPGFVSPADLRNLRNAHSIGYRIRLAARLFRLAR